MNKKKPVKVVETQVVTDKTLERIINEAVLDGWVLDGIHFAMRDSSKRPTMAFLMFFNSEYAEKFHSGDRVKNN